MTEERLAEIRKRLKDTPGGMHSACGEYECDCHRDMPALLDEIDRLRAALRPFADIYAKGSHDPSDPEHCLSLLNQSWVAAELLRVTDGTHAQ